MRITVTCVVALAVLASVAACGEDPDPTDPTTRDNDVMQSMHGVHSRPLPFEQVEAIPDRPRIPRIRPVPAVPVGGVDFDPSEALPLRDDAQVMHVLLTLNSAQIALADEALLRLRTAQMRDFAIEVREAHMNANRKLRSVLDGSGMKLTPSDVSLRLRERALSELDALREVNAVEVDKNFIALEVRAQRRALAVIDELLLPLAEHDDVHTLVSASRTEIERHLVLALRLQTLADADDLDGFDM